MHMRGKAMSMEAIYPDGRKRSAEPVNNFQWNWHVNYVYADRRRAAPAEGHGARLHRVARQHAANPNNPDPRQWVGWGDRTVDEMAHVWVDVTYLNPEDYQKLAADRKAKK